MTAESAKIRIDIVSDVVCPWCIIGFKQLQRALAELEGEVEAEIHWHPFELNPQMPPEGQDLREHVAQKYGASAEQSRATRERLSQIAESLGVEFNLFEEMRIHNTFKAHQLLQWAAEQGKQTELELALFEIYFTRRENPDEPDILVAAAGRAGLAEAEAAAVLSDARFAETVRAEQRFWLSKGIHAVPSFILDQRYLIPGAQDPKVFVAALNKLAEEKAD